MIARRRRFNWGAVFAAGVRLSGWIAVNALAAAGTIAVIAFAVGSFSLPLTMAQLANLADRYVAADGERQTQFNHIVMCGFAAAFLCIAFFRRGSLNRTIGSAENV